MDKPAAGRHVVALRGGLGNQLFQLSYALYLARQGKPVSLDLSCLRHGVPDLFQIPLIGEEARQMVLPVTRIMPSPAGLLGRIGRLPRRALKPDRIVLDDSAQGPAPSSDLPPAWWFGYWQRLSYAEAVIPLLRTGLLGNDPADTLVAGTTAQGGSGQVDAGSQTRDRTVLRVHVRGGDYAGNAMALPAGWYRRAVDAVFALDAPPAQIEVVTNDPQWCTRSLDLGRPYRLLPTGTALGDMRSLATADFLVISRSTFSWWAAAASSATVVAPDSWFPATPQEPADDLLPARWLTCTT